MTSLTAVRVVLMSFDKREMFGRTLKDVQKTVVCYECNERVDIDDAEKFEGYWYDTDCLNEITHRCGICEERSVRLEMHCINEDTSEIMHICSCCFDKDWVKKCKRCEFYYQDSHGHVDSTNGSFYCDGCYDQHYITCNTCDRIFDFEDSFSHEDEYYCERCIPETKDIHNYEFKPDPIFHGTDGGRYFGIEIEIVNGFSTNDTDARDFVDLMGGEGYVYCKSDGSLNEKGFEIVSHPCTYDYHMNQMAWADLFREAIERDYLSDMANDKHGVSAGLHIHISRATFGNVKKQDTAIMKLLFMVERMWDELVQFSRRDESAIDEYCDRYHASCDDTPQTLHERVKNSISSTKRYHALNLENEDTIEFRLFNGTLNIQTFRASLQLVNILTDLARDMSLQEIQDISWSMIKEYGVGYQEFTAYCQRRGL